MSLLCAAVALVLTVDPVSEVEPNQTRATATPAAISPGAAFTGTTRGFIEDPASLGADTRDVWRVTLNANPALIQRHTLQVSTGGTQGHTGAIIGVQASAGVIDPDSMVPLQSTSINTVPARYCAVYTLGNAAPSFIYRITGSPGTSSPYTVAVASQPITPVDVQPCPFASGQITVSTVGRTTLNTKVFLFSGETLAPIDGGINDDAAGATATQSELRRTLAPGTYIIAVANGGAADNRTPPADDRAATQATWTLTESPGLLVNASNTTTGDFSFTVSDAYGSRNVAAAKPGAFGIAFFRFTVADRCGWADLGRVGGNTCADNALDNNDFVVYVNAFFSANLPVADLGKVGGAQGRDDRLDNNDWIVFLDRFFEGC